MSQTWPTASGCPSSPFSQRRLQIVLLPLLLSSQLARHPGSCSDCGLASSLIAWIAVDSFSVLSQLIPLLVATEDLERANSRMVGATIAGNRLIGPANGGLLFAVGASVPFLTNASLLACAFLLLAGLPVFEQAQYGSDSETAAEPSAVDGNSRIPWSVPLPSLSPVPPSRSGTCSSFQPDRGQHRTTCSDGSVSPFEGQPDTARCGELQTPDPCWLRPRPTPHFPTRLKR